MCLFNIDVLIKKRKVKKFKREIELIRTYRRYKDRCETCKYYQHKKYYSYGYYEKIKCAIEVKNIACSDDRVKCNFYKMHKEYKAMSNKES